MTCIGYVDPDALDAPELREPFQRAVLHSTPRPAVQAFCPHRHRLLGTRRAPETQRGTVARPVQEGER
jgi:hypothetical protein